MIRQTPVASFIKEVNPRLAKRQLKTNGHLAHLELASLVKEANCVFHKCLNDIYIPYIIVQKQMRSKSRCVKGHAARQPTKCRHIPPTSLQPPGLGCVGKLYGTSVGLGYPWNINQTQSALTCTVHEYTIVTFTDKNIVKEHISTTISWHHWVHFYPLVCSKYCSEGVKRSSYVLVWFLFHSVMHQHGELLTYSLVVSNVLNVINVGGWQTPVVTLLNFNTVRPKP